MRKGKEKRKEKAMSILITLQKLAIKIKYKYPRCMPVVDCMDIISREEDLPLKYMQQNHYPGKCFMVCLLISSQIAYILCLTC